MGGDFGVGAGAWEAWVPVAVASRDTSNKRIGNILVDIIPPGSAYSRRYFAGTAFAKFPMYYLIGADFINEADYCGSDHSSYRNCESGKGCSGSGE
jgi:hypothetical protein